MDQKAVLDLYFIENRSKILDLAAFIDRFSRSAAGGDAASDPRWRGVLRALQVLVDRDAEKARRILELWSDPTESPIDQAGMKGAVGVWPELPGLPPGRSTQVR